MGRFLWSIIPVTGGTYLISAFVPDIREGWHFWATLAILFAANSMGYMERTLQRDTWK